MYAKIVNSQLVIAGYKTKIKNGYITNPTLEQLIKNGYKEVIYNDKPEYDKEEEKLVETYTETDVITVNYEKITLTNEEHNAIIKQEIVAEESKITDRNYREAIKDLKAKKETSYALDKIDEIETNIATLRAKIRK